MSEPRGRINTGNIVNRTDLVTQQTAVNHRGQVTQDTEVNQSYWLTQ